MIGVLLRDRPRAVELLREYDAHQSMRQRQTGYTHAHVCLGFETRVEPIGATDEERDIIAVCAPLLDQSREFHRREIAAAFVERNAGPVSGKRGAQTLGFGSHQRDSSLARDARLGPDLAQGDFEIDGHARRIVLVCGIDPCRHARAHSGDDELHREAMRTDYSDAVRRRGVRGVLEAVFTARFGVDFDVVFRAVFGAILDFVFTAGFFDAALRAAAGDGVREVFVAGAASAPPR